MGLITKSGLESMSAEHLDALALLEKGDAKGAVLALADLADKDPYNTRLCVDMGNALMAVGMVEPAVTAARHAIELDSECVDAFRLLATSLQVQGLHEEAAVALDRALSITLSGKVDVSDFENEDVPWPVTFAKYSAIFHDYNLKGDSRNLIILSESEGAPFRIKFLVGDSAEYVPEDSWELVEEGMMERARLLGALDKKQQTVMTLFPAESFSYKLEKKRA